VGDAERQEIESSGAVERAGEISAVPGIDALFVGPADLAGSLGLPVGTTDPRMIEALKRVVAAGQSVGRCVGIDAVSNERLEAYAGMGYRLFTFGSDFGYLNEGGRGTAEFARGVGRKAQAKTRRG
jgi:4-hydroxy-2-oxoheptanedioate aldolase